MAPSSTPHRRDQPVWRGTSDAGALGAPPQLSWLPRSPCPGLPAWPTGSIGERQEMFPGIPTANIRSTQSCRCEQ